MRGKRENGNGGRAARRPGGQGKGKRAGGLSRSPAVLEWFEFLVVLYSIPMVLKRLNEN